MLSQRYFIMRRLFRGVLALIAVVVLGAVGFYVLKHKTGWTAIDAVYMSITTVATVGLGDVSQLNQVDRVFTAGLVLFGVAAFTYTITSIGNYLIAGELQGFLQERRMEKKIEHLKDHYILCGYGRMGEQVADEFRREKTPFVVIDSSEAAAERAKAAGYLALVGDAGHDDILCQAGIERAVGLVTSIDTDAVNLMVVLSARAMNEKLLIVARANVRGTESKLLTAGANRVLWPYGVSGRRLAQMALRPHVVKFLEMVMHDEELELLLEELTVALGSPLDDCTIGNARIRDTTGATILALRQRDGRMTISPPPSTVLKAGDIMVALGTQEQLGKLRELAHGRKAGG